MSVEGSVAPVTGANRGLGKSLCAALLDRGAARVDAGARSPDSVSMLDGLVAGDLDVLADEISRNVRAALSGDVTALDPILGAAR